MSYRYNLDKGAKKYTCPQCEKKRLVRYIDEETGNLIPEQYGRCDREVSCGYHRKPHAAKNRFDDVSRKQHLKKTKPVIFPTDVMKRTLIGYEQNVFIQNLIPSLGYEILGQVVGMYYLGTITKGARRGAVTFPFIDIHGGVRTVQVKQFDKENHTTSTDFLHSILSRYYSSTGESMPAWLPKYVNQDLKVSCLFGEHLLRSYPNNPIALVEAPKTAVYGAAHFGLPKDSNRLLWLAVYNLSSLNVERCRVLAGREVLLLPDLSVERKAYKLWSDRTEKIRREVDGSFHVSELLEWIATDNDRKMGMDLADYLDRSKELRALDLMRLKNPVINHLLDFLGEDAAISVDYNSENSDKHLIDYKKLFESVLDLKF